MKRLNYVSEFDGSYSSLCENLTIMVLTFNRPKALLRQLNMLSRFPGPVIVLDGGVSKLIDLDTCARPSRLRYIKANHFYDRFKRAGTILTTKYAMTFSDDDLLVPSGINKLMEEIISKSTTDSVFGRMLYAYPIKNSWGFKVWNPNYSSLDGRSILSDNPDIRAITHFSNYVSTYYYSVMRVEVWQNTFSKLKLSNEDLYINPYSTELAYEFLGARAGTSKILPVLCGIRVKDHKPTWVNINDNGHKPVYMYQWLNDNKFKNSVEDYKSAIVQASSKLISGEPIKQVLEKSLLMYSKVEQKTTENAFVLDLLDKKNIRVFTWSNLKILIEVLLIRLNLQPFLTRFKIYTIEKSLVSYSISFNRKEIRYIIPLFFYDFKIR